MALLEKMLIGFFNYYYTFLQLDPDDVSEQLKRQGASIPLVRPGKSTATFIRTVLSRISILGSVFLAILGAGPAVVEQTTHLTAFRGFTGTSVLILVGCATDTARKVEAEIISGIGSANIQDYLMVAVTTIYEYMIRSGLCCGTMMNLPSVLMKFAKNEALLSHFIFR